MKYTPIGFKTDYSLLKSLFKVDDIINLALKNNSEYIGILDDNPYSIAEFYYKCVQNNIKPVIGVSLIIEGYKIYFYLEDFNGYKNIIKLKYLYDENKLNLSVLKRFNSGLIVVLPYESLNLYNKLKTVFKTYLSYKNNYELDLITKYTKNIIFLNEICVKTKSEERILKLLYKINDTNYNGSYNYILEASDKDIRTIENFVKKINFKFNFNNNYIPSYTKSKKESINLLNNLALKGLSKRLNKVKNKVYIDRLKYELDVINGMNFTDYFLIVYDYVKYAKKNNIYVGPGRGSAAGSLVSYSLGITNVDPIKHDLLFERFLNPERVTMPDIDIDFEDIKRNDVIDYVRKKYGTEKVSLIIAYQTMKARLVIRDVGRVLNIDSSVIDKLSKMLDQKYTLKENLKNDKVLNYVKENRLQTFYKLCIKLEGLKKNTTIHAAGVIICNDSIYNVVPVFKTDNDLIAGFTMEYLEKIGLLKMDFLALKNLNQMHKIIDKIGNIDINKIPLNDKNTINLFREANTDNIFQFESSGMKNFLRKLKPSSFDDLVSANALFRPGPMDNIDTYVKRKNGNEKINYYHPNLEKVLKPTYGIIVYQEQIMQILSIMAGYSYAEADLIRRAMSKKKKEVMDKEKLNFINKSVQNGYDEKLSNEIYDMILKFSNYGFNKSHSVAYALLGYQMAYLKANYPKEFQTINLNMNFSSNTKIKDIIDEALSKNIEIVKPDVNISKENYEIVDDKIVLPLHSIKNISSTISKQIVNNKPYKDFFDFVLKNKKILKEENLTTLIKSGALNSIYEHKNTLLENINSAFNYADLCEKLDIDLIEKPELEESILQDEPVDELEYFGFYVSGHPAKINRTNEIPISKLKNYLNKKVNIICLVDKINEIKTKKNEPMAFLKISDESGKIDAVVFPRNYELLSSIETNSLVRINAQINTKDDKIQCIVDDIKSIK